MSALLEVTDLAVEFRQPGWRTPPLRAVDGVSFGVDERETVGLVGESGSGKSTIGRCVLGLTPAAAGSIRFDGSDITHASPRRRRALAAELQVVFQDPYGSLDPLRTIGQTIAEPLETQARMSGAEMRARIESLLRRVGLPGRAMANYPAQFSGGQRQRIAIARALAVGPRLVVCDEPISSLDLSTQAQVLNLLQDLQRQFGLAYLFIAHDLVAVRHLSHRVLVLYRGRIMEAGTSREVCDEPLHPYSRALWAAAPVPDPAEQERRRAHRTMTVRAATSVWATPTIVGCPFAPRCPEAAAVCVSQRPGDFVFGGRTLACHLFSPASAHPRGEAFRREVQAGSSLRTDLPQSPQSTYRERNQI